MLKIENFEVLGWEHAIRGMRNPKNSWDRSDSEWSWIEDDSPINPSDAGLSLVIGPNDHKLLMSLADGGPVHAKYRRMITVYLDITAPLYWWKEFDTYKVGTVANSCSTMHKIHAKEFTLEDFSHEQLMCGNADPDIRRSYTIVPEHDGVTCLWSTTHVLNTIINALNVNRKAYLETNDKRYWWQMIQLLPTSYNQKRTVMLNYEVLANIYKWRRNHKLDEWHTFCDWIEELPYSELITGYKEEQE
ncbi:hypothetical protein [Fibrobacter sp.]|uniref:hypothetical protein n=1 Tax=Fibrobacter sp. TaxID=35828 RepID=UPI00388FC238